MSVTGFMVGWSLDALGLSYSQTVVCLRSLALQLPAEQAGLINPLIGAPAQDQAVLLPDTAAGQVEARVLESHTEVQSLSVSVPDVDASIVSNEKYKGDALLQKTFTDYYPLELFSLEEIIDSGAAYTKYFLQFFYFITSFLHYKTPPTYCSGCLAISVEYA